MVQTTITLDLPDAVAREAVAQGLLTPEAMLRLLSAELDRRHRPSTLSRARGLLAGGANQLSDVDIARWLEERRTERYQ